ncbi:MAG: hypothetical protein JRH15_16705, partial [Deltaproteobacteria bacterium]|nr:hypothetical protein [Deltaproteobacteria bacterium]
YLKWSFVYEYPNRRRVQRDNPRDYLSGCRALHQMLTRYAKNNPSHCKGDGLKFLAVKQPIAAILSFQGKKEDRIRKWRSEAQQGNLGGMAFRIPPYAPEHWLKEAAALGNTEDSVRALRSHLYRFYQAASIHRQYVLRELLPDYGLIVA